MARLKTAGLTWLVLILSTVSEAKVWTKCEVLKELQTLHVSDVDISRYLCIAEMESQFDSNIDSHNIITGPLEGDPVCNYHTYGIFQIRSFLSSCTDKDLDAKCETNNESASCDVNCSEFRNDDLSDDIVCLDKILKTNNSGYWSHKTRTTCLEKNFEKNQIESLNSICSGVIQTEKTPKLGFTGTSFESTIKTHNKTVVCVLSPLSYRRPTIQAKYNLEDFDPELCTHLLYRAAVIDGESFKVISADSPLDTDESGPKWFTEIPKLKTRHSQLKVILSIGGWNAGIKSFQDVASDPKKRTVFIKSAVQTLKKFKFDGMDILWMWPALGYRGGKTQDKSDLTNLLADMKKSFNETGLILTITMNGNPEIIQNGYDLAEITKSVDQIHLLAIDYAGSWNDFTGHHAALYSADPKSPSVAKLVDFLIAEKVSSHKLVLGIPFFGRTFALQDPTVKNGLGNSSKGGFSGEFYPDSQEIGYNEICHELENNTERWTFFRDTNARAPFAKSGNRWISFDDPESIREKVEFGMCKDLKGFMAWSIDTDDFKGENCNPKGIKYPLLRSINSILTKLSKNGRTIGDSECANPRFAGIPSFPKTSKASLLGICSYIQFLGIFIWLTMFSNLMT